MKEKQTIEQGLQDNIHIVLKYAKQHYIQLFHSMYGTKTSNLRYSLPLEREGEWD